MKGWTGAGLGVAILALAACVQTSHSLGGQAPAIEHRFGEASIATLAAEARSGARARLADRIPGWEVLDVDQAPDLGLGPLPIDDARRLNALLAARAPATGAAPFFLHASKAERGRALLCLSQAIYYEAALEPPEGQEAVAQTVLNRVRHPDFPKSICGVVYQGSAQVTGCQFSFTCDGSRARPPIEPFWSRAQAVAERAL
ncbi:MAG: cell wall hydrolase, partial [Caulobacteraceae bacterium]|nr:cell wall hydrolase [Caulobacteraceae bacterium]